LHPDDETLGMVAKVDDLLTELKMRLSCDGVVAAWLGNTPDVANKHYLSTTEQDFQQAARSSDTKFKSLDITLEGNRSAQGGA
jgi:hypothetical protein